MGKLSVGLYCPKWKSMYWIKGPSEYCKKLWTRTLSRDQYSKYCTLDREIKETKGADCFELIGEGEIVEDQVIQLYAEY